jgi:hypothetical protein
LRTSNESSSNQSSLPCQRYCPIRINKIYYADNPKGLGDRIIVLRGLSQLAGYLCAEVIMPPPREHLAIDHNFGKPISEEVQWSDFVNITFIQDGSPTIKSAKTWRDEAGINITSWSANIPAFNLSTSAKYKDWLHVVSVDGNMRDDFKAIQKFPLNNLMMLPLDLYGKFTRDGTHPICGWNVCQYWISQPHKNKKMQSTTIVKK